MSIPDDPRSFAELRVVAHDDSEIYVLGADLATKAYGVASVHERLRKGIYKVRTVRGGTTVERLVDLQKNIEIFLHRSPVSAIAPVGPVYGNWSGEINGLAGEAVAAAHAAVESDGSVEGASVVLLMAHRDSEVLADPLAEMTLYRWLDMRHRMSPRSSRLERQCGEEWWSAWAVIVEPGYYQIEFGNGALRQALLVVPNYDTRVFVRRTAPSLLAEGQRSEIGKTETSVQMAVPGSEVFYWDHYETIEVARRALETERPIIVHERLVDQLLWGKWDNPLMGVMGAHLFLAALERDRDDDEGRRQRRVDLEQKVRAEARETLRVVLDNLENVLGGGWGYLPSDLVALHLRASPFTGEKREFEAVLEPPMFWASWETLVAHSVPGGPVAISRELWSRVSRAYPSGPYFGWRSGRVSVDAQIEELVGWALERGATLGIGETLAIAPIVAAYAGFVASKGRAGRASSATAVLPADAAQEIASALGAPLSLVSGSETS